MDAQKKNVTAKELLGRLRVIKVNDFEELIVFLSIILSQIRNKKITYDLRMIVIDSLSALFNAIAAKP